MLRNAIALLDDAGALRSNKSYGSAAALAILCIEELAKIAILHPSLPLTGVSRPPHKAGRQLSHHQKQRAAGELLVGALGVDQVRALVNLKGYEIQVAPITNDAVPRPTISDIIASIKDETFDERRARRLRQRKHLRYVVKLMRGEFESLKRACFYADVDANGLAHAPSMSADRETADKMIKLANSALVLLEIDLGRAVTRNERQQRLSSE